MADIIKVQKLAGIKKAFLLSRDNISIIEERDAPGIHKAIEYDSEAHIYKFDNEEAGPKNGEARENTLIAYEEKNDSNCPNGWNLWNIGSLDKLDQLGLTYKSPTEFYQKSVTRTAIFFENIKEVKAFIQQRSSSDYFNEKIEFTDKELTIHCSWGDAKGKIDNCFIVFYGTDDFGIVTLGTDSIESYVIVDNSDKVLKKLSEY